MTNDEWANFWGGKGRRKGVLSPAAQRMPQPRPSRWAWGMTLTFLGSFSWFGGLVTLKSRNLLRMTRSKVKADSKWMFFPAHDSFLIICIRSSCLHLFRIANLVALSTSGWLLWIKTERSSQGKGAKEEGGCDAREAQRSQLPTRCWTSLSGVVWRWYHTWPRKGPKLQVFWQLLIKMHGQSSTSTMALPIRLIISRQPAPSSIPHWDANTLKSTGMSIPSLLWELS